MPNKVILGFDAGSHKIGVAVGQTLTLHAKPLDKLPAKKGLPLSSDIKKLILEWKPTVLVVGIPRMMNGKEQFTTTMALQLIDFLKALTHLPVYSVDERLTTKNARSELFEQGGFKKLKKANVDSYAAKLIVESWMHEPN